MALTALNALLPSRGNNPPPEIRSFLRDFGQHGIVGLAVCRKPIVAAVKLVLDIISFGQVSRNQKALGYDAILHLFLALTLQDPRTSVRTFHLLEKNETVHTVPIPWDYFNNSTTENTTGHLVAHLKVFNSQSVTAKDFDEEPGIRLLTLKARTNENAITFDQTPRTDYKMGYFVDGSLAKDTGWQYFLDQFYPSLQSSLQKNKMITKQFFLSEIDVAQYDPHKLVFDGHAYYIVNEIKSFIAGKSTTVELFKVS